MRETRSIRLFFVIAAILIIACFWIGFSFGKKSQSRIDLAEYEQIAEQENSTQLPDDREKTITNEKSAGAAEDSINSQYLENDAISDKDTALSEDADDQSHEADSDTSVSGSVYQTPKFYLKDDGDYLTVYVAATDEVYFETDLKTSDLPLELQEDTVSGIPFYDLEDLYHFLENYSS